MNIRPKSPINAEDQYFGGSKERRVRTVRTARVRSTCAKNVREKGNRPSGVRRFDAAAFLNDDGAETKVTAPPHTLGERKADTSTSEYREGVADAD